MKETEIVVSPENTKYARLALERMFEVWLILKSL
jgi:hypothetical protein